MIILYQIGLYDAKSGGQELIAVLPERRKEPRKTNERGMIERWVKETFGEKWWLANWANVGISKKLVSEEGGAIR